MTGTEKPFARNAGTCSSCGATVEKGKRGWTNSEAPAGRWVRCLICGPGDSSVHIDPVAGSSALRLDARRRGDNYLKGIVAIESELSAAISGHFPTNTATCSGVITVMAKTPIVPDSGTMAYKGISGTLNMTVTINEVAEAPKCPRSDASPFLAQTIFFTGSGKVSM